MHLTGWCMATMSATPHLGALPVMTRSCSRGVRLLCPGLKPVLFGQGSTAWPAAVRVRPRLPALPGSAAVAPRESILRSMSLLRPLKSQAVPLDENCSVRPVTPQDMVWYQSFVRNDLSMLHTTCRREEGSAAVHKPRQGDRLLAATVLHLGTPAAERCCPACGRIEQKAAARGQCQPWTGSPPGSPLHFCCRLLQTSDTHRQRRSPPPHDCNGSTPLTVCEPGMLLLSAVSCSACCHPSAA